MDHFIKYGDSYVDQESVSVYIPFGANQGKYYCAICHSNSCSSNSNASSFTCNCTKYGSEANAENHISSEHKKYYKYEVKTYHFSLKSGCGRAIAGTESGCGSRYKSETSWVESQKLFLSTYTGYDDPVVGEISIQIPVTTSIEVTKKWNDYNNVYDSTREEVNLNVYRSIEQNPKDWGKPLTLNTDYTVEWPIPTGNEWKAEINGLLRQDENGNKYYFKVEEQEQKCYNASYSSGSYTEGQVADSDNKTITITNTLKKIVLSGYVWLDGQTGIKPARTNDGLMQDTETKIAGIKVVLYKKAPGNEEYSPIEETVTDENGYYKFKDIEIGRYYVRFKYDGINYEDTISVEGDIPNKSKAFEYNDTRATFNADFHTIIPGKSLKENGENGKNLSYDYQNGKSTLATKNSDGSVNSDFEMNANIEGALYKFNTENLNLGLVKRGMDIALSTDVYDAKVTINGQETEYKYSGENDLKIIKDEVTGEYIIGNNPTSNIVNEQEVPYNLNLYASDYNYRIRDYVSNNRFTQENYTEQTNFDEKQTGAELEVYVTYKLKLQNQTTKNVTINEAKYIFDAKYTFDKLEGAGYELNGNVITIKSVDLGDGNTKTIYITFKVDKTAIGTEAKLFSNKAEITSYSTEEGLIDVDSQPGNFLAASAQVEDDSDTAGGLTIKVDNTLKRTITGKVFDKEGNTPVNDVIVQLIELKEFEVSGQKKVYEYIWQETVSGSGTGYKTPMVLNPDGTITDLEPYEYTVIESRNYEFSGYIPGNYIVRFIYGDGSSSLLGDVNCDGVVDSFDLVLLYDSIREEQIRNSLNAEARLNADLTNDSKINMGDASSLISKLKLVNNKDNSFGDVNCDGNVETGDLQKLYNCIYKGETLTEAEREKADLKNDGKIDQEDLTLLCMHLNQYIIKNESLNNVIKYNGQDYKSVIDSNYSSEWYNSSSYTEGSSVARDNEARRLETMAYSIEIDASKGILLKLLDNPSVDDLNQTEKETLIAKYNTLYDPDITNLTEGNICRLLTKQVLNNTWMCAETSKICVPVETATDTISNSGIPAGISVASSYSNINLGLEKRPETRIELKKYITGFKLTAANGQTLVNATIDVDEYLNNPGDISNKVQGIKDSVQILPTEWKYAVGQTEINTVIDGANLEFEYTLVVKNTGDNDYLGETLANVYKNSSMNDYRTTLEQNVTTIKGYMRTGTYCNNIGGTLGNTYYAGGEAGTSEGKVLTEVTNIRDYVNNDLTFVFSYEGEVDIDETALKTHRILRDDYSIQETTLNTILKTTEGTGKMSNQDNAVMYTVTLGKNPISSTGKLEFDSYIAEVMSYTNAAGRRAMTSTPGNAEIVEAYPEEWVGKHEIDEASTGRIEIGVIDGEDKQTNYIVIISIIAGIALIAAGAFVVKKYVIK